MARAAFEAVKGLLEEKICGRRSERAGFRRADDILFIIGKDGLAEGLTDIASLWDSFSFGSECDEKTKFDGGDDGCKTV